MENRINLYNRYRGNNVYLEIIDGNTYQLVLEGVYYIRTIHDGAIENKTVCGIDPEGGPFMEIGGLLESKNGKKYTIDDLHWDNDKKKWILQITENNNY